MNSISILAGTNYFGFSKAFGVCHCKLQLPRNKSDYSVPSSVVDTTATGCNTTATGYHTTSTGCRVYYFHWLSRILLPPGIIRLSPADEDTTATGCRGYYCHRLSRILLPPGVNPIAVNKYTIIIIVRGTDKYVFTTRRATTLSYF